MARVRTEKIRLDRLLVERGLANSRERAQGLILAGQVLVNEQKQEKCGTLVDGKATLRLLGEPPKYVSRGGLKLEGALEHFRVNPDAKVCLDIGASTGGFTDCLLQRGAAKVYAIDVGRGQLDWKLRSDPRVVLREGINARYLKPEDIGEPADLAVADVSFISAILKPNGEMIILIKPQFEAGREQVGKGGIVRDPAIQEVACARVREAVEALGYRTKIIESPIRGAEGNREFLLYGTH